MRISDWSSDVCSSDLTPAADSLEGPVAEPTAAEVVATLQAEADTILAEDRASCLAIGEHGAALLHHGMRILTHGHSGALATGAIGRASCRERVWQYGSMSGCAAARNKKNKRKM